MTADPGVKRAPIPFNGEMLRWARNWRQRSLGAAAKRAGVTPDVVERWEQGADSPTVRQARLLADLYERPFLEFFATEEPSVPLPAAVPDFRRRQPLKYTKSLFTFPGNWEGTLPATRT